jgi:hypothetical protein
MMACPVRCFPKKEKSLLRKLGREEMEIWQIMLAVAFPLLAITALAVVCIYVPEQKGSLQQWRKPWI